MTDRPNNILPYGLALFALGAGTLAITLLAIAAPDVTFFRTIWTSWLSMAITAVAIIAFALGKVDGPRWPWWRAFWTAGYLAYVLHFRWAVFQTYNGDLSAVIERQEWLVGYSNFLITAFWGADVILAWLPQKLRPAIMPYWLHTIVWAWVTASFVLAASRTFVGTIVGYGLAAVVLGILAWRFRHLFPQLLAWILAKLSAARRIQY